MDESDALRSGQLPSVGGALQVPLPGECLACYVWRMLAAEKCNATLRWTAIWRDARAPRATALERKLARRGGFCDCELLLNIFVPTGSPTTLTAQLSWREIPRGGPCAGVRKGSARPCRLWVERR